MTQLTEGQTNKIRSAMRTFAATIKIAEEEINRQYPNGVGAVKPEYQTDDDMRSEAKETFRAAVQMASAYLYGGGA